MNFMAADKTHEAAWIRLRLRLWPKHTPAEFRKDFRRILDSNREAVFLATDPAGRLAGFAEFSIRDYVDGCKTRPVGYLEGIYVRPKSRKQGVAARLVGMGEAWASAQGCREMGSDTGINNRKSITFHQSLGFRITERHVVFLKGIPKTPPTRPNRVVP